MRDICLQAAGAIAILAAIAHGIIGETKIFTKAPYPGEGTRRLLRLIWQASTVDWIVLGGLLMVAPSLGSASARTAIVAAATITYGYAALGNAYANRGRHIGWVLMCAVVVLAPLGR